MQKILIIGEEEKAQLLRSKLNHGNFEIEVSDGDEEEDFKEFDVIFDLNFDDDSENFPIYARLRDKLISSSVKQSLAESSYIYPEKVRSKIFGINAIDHYLSGDLWELSAYRNSEWKLADDFMKMIGRSYLTVDDQVGMYRPRIDFLAINEKIRLIHLGWVAESHVYIQDELKTIDEIGITPIFETLMAIYEDTKEPQFLPHSLLKEISEKSFVYQVRYASRRIPTQTISRKPIWLPFLSLPKILKAFSIGC